MFVFILCELFYFGLMPTIAIAVGIRLAVRDEQATAGNPTKGFSAKR